MAFYIKGPFNRATHNPGICRACPCSEFLAVEASINTTYTGFEKCLACRHKASHHVWGPINPQVSRGHSRSVDSTRDALEGLAEASASAQRFHIGASGTPASGRSPSPPAVDSVLAPQPEPQLPVSPSRPPLQTPKPQDSLLPFGFGDASPPSPAPPLPIIEVITLENLYDYIVARSDHSDVLQRRLARDGQKFTALLDTMHRDLAAHRAEMKVLGDTVQQLAENYWNEHRLAGSPTRSLFLKDLALPGAGKAGASVRGRNSDEWRREFGKLKTQPIPGSVASIPPSSYKSSMPEEAGSEASPPSYSSSPASSSLASSSSASSSSFSSSGSPVPDETRPIPTPPASSEATLSENATEESEVEEEGIVPEETDSDRGSQYELDDKGRRLRELYSGVLPMLTPISEEVVASSRGGKLRYESPKKKRVRLPSSPAEEVSKRRRYNRGHIPLVSEVEVEAEAEKGSKVEGGEEDDDVEVAGDSTASSEVSNSPPVANSGHESDASEKSSSYSSSSSSSSSSSFSSSSSGSSSSDILDEQPEKRKRDSTSPSQHPPSKRVRASNNRRQTLGGRVTIERARRNHSNRRRASDGDCDVS